MECITVVVFVPIIIIIGEVVWIFSMQKHWPFTFMVIVVMLLFWYVVTSCLVMETVVYWRMLILLVFILFSWSGLMCTTRISLFFACLISRLNNIILLRLRVHLVRTVAICC